jgi:hypothetical protein
MADSNDELAGLIRGMNAQTSHDEVAELFAAMRTPGDPSELANASEAVTALTHAIRQSPTPLHSRRRPVLSKLMTTKAAVVAAVVLAGGSAAAATNGSLPGPAQQAVAHAMSHVGVSVPDGHDTDHGKTTAKGPDAAGPAKYGLCKAWASGSNTGRSHKANAVAFTNLQAAASAAHQSVTDYCKDAVPGEPTTPTDGHHGPPVSTPNHGTGNPNHSPHNSNGHGHAAS